MDIGLERAGMHIKWQVENNDYCREVLRKHWPNVPCHYDITTIDWRDIPRVDLVCGGFPCQPFSLAGKRRGKDDDRYLWPEVVRCLSVIKPTWFLGENVPGLLNLGFEQVCVDLETLGYETATLCIPACAVDAPHIRKRLWILAHTDSGRFSEQGIRQEQPRRAEAVSASEVREGCDVAAAAGMRREERNQNTRRSRKGTSQTKERPRLANSSRWPTEPAICRVVDGIPNRSHRLGGLGNAIVPQIAEEIGRMILEASR